MELSLSALRSHDAKDHIGYLRADAYKVIIAIVLLCAYLWLTATVWPTTGWTTRIEAWIGSLLLALGATVSLLVHRQRTLAYLLLLTTLLAATILAAVAYSSIDILYLLVVPVLFSSVLLGQTAVLLFGGLSATLAFGILSASDVLAHYQHPYIPTLVLVAATLAALASVRNLYTALHWATKSYERIEANERLLQEHQSELKQALKSLDTVSYNLERANVMLGLARQRADQSLRLKQEFAQNMSHELRTPLNLIVGFTETMMQSPEYYGGALPTAYLRDLSIIYRNATHLQSLVNDVLDLARIEAAQMTLTTEETDPETLVRDAVEAIRSMVESRRLYLRVEIGPALPTVHVDPTRIRQVIFNIVNNAVRFTEHGGVTVSVRRLGNDVLVAIQDTGIGIDKDELTRVFEAFHQSENAPEKRRGGVGIGLTISKQFVELHGGHIWAESQPGAGSTFYFTIPAHQVIPRAGRPWPDEEPVAYPAYAIANERIVLVVTRSVSAATLLSRYLQDCRAVFVDNLEQARTFAQRGAPQLVVIDSYCEQVSTSDLDALAKTWQLEHIHFLTCPLPGEEQLRQRLATQGYLIKPVSRKNLWDAVLQIPGPVNRVLVIDDDPDFVRLMQRMLNHPAQRYQITTAYTAREGLAKMAQQRPDLILMDIGLPDINGLRLLEQVRSNPNFQDTPVIIVSGHDDIDIVESLSGSLVVSRAAGLVRGDIVQWIQRILDTATRVSNHRQRDVKSV